MMIVDARSTAIASSKNHLRALGLTTTPYTGEEPAWENVTAKDVQALALEALRAGKDPATDKDVTRALAAWQLSETGLAPAIQATHQQARLRHEFAELQRAVTEAPAQLTEDVAALNEAAQLLQVRDLNAAYTGTARLTILHGRARAAQERLTALASLAESVNLAAKDWQAGTIKHARLAIWAPLDYRTYYNLTTTPAAVAGAPVTPWLLAQSGTTIDPTGDPTEIRSRIRALLNAEKKVKEYLDKRIFEPGQSGGRGDYATAFAAAVNNQPIPNRRGESVTTGRAWLTEDGPRATLPDAVDRQIGRHA